MSSIKERVKSFLSIVSVIWHRWRSSETEMRAASLAFSTTFSLIPLTGVILAAATAFPELFSPMDFLRENLAPHLMPSALAETMVAAKGFAEGVRKLSGIGVASTLLFGLLLSMTLEETVAKCWGCDVSKKPMLTRLLAHWAILTAGPLMLLAFLPGLFVATKGWSFIALPILLLGSLTILHKICPSNPPSTGRAFAAGSSSVILLWILKTGFDAWWTAGTSYGTIYGAFASVVVFPLWIWAAWMMVLAPAALMGKGENNAE